MEPWCEQVKRQQFRIDISDRLEMDNDGRPTEFVNIASQTVSRFLWTFSNDLCNKLLERGVSKELLNETSNKVLKRYVDTGIKLKLAVTARVKREKGLASTSSNVLSIINRIKKNIHNVNWEPHPGNPTTMYTKEIRFYSKRYPLMKDNKLVGTVDDNGSYDPTDGEIGEAQLYGFEL
ncbi:hypothetical protein DFQ30_000531 [Apophysomyces sp. BC1015]|nr:hypothetical protein DFQ30_000531 [Apophysomyces sp. BC1015]